MTQVLTPKVTLSPLPASVAQAIKKSQAESPEKISDGGTTLRNEDKGLWPGQGLRTREWAAGCLHGCQRSSQGGGWALVPGLLAYPVWPGPEKQVFSVYWTCQKASVSLASGREISSPRLALWRPGGVSVGWLGAPCPPALVRGKG